MGIEDGITLSFQLPGIAGIQIAHGSVRNVRQDDKLAEVGMQFNESNTNAIENIEAYVKSVMEISPSSI